MSHRAPSIIKGFTPADIVGAGERVMVTGWIREGMVRKTVIGIFSDSAELERQGELGNGVPRVADKVGRNVAVGTIDYSDDGASKAVVFMTSDTGEKWSKTELAGFDLIGLRIRMDGRYYAWSASRLAIIDHGQWAEIGRIDAEYELTKFAHQCSDHDVVIIAGSRRNGYEHWVVAPEGDHFAKLAPIPGRVTGVASVGNGTMIVAVEREGESGFELIAWSPRNPRELIRVGQYSSGHVEAMAIHNGNLLMAGNDGVLTNPWTSTLWHGLLMPDRLGPVELKATRLNMKKAEAIGFAEDMSLWCFSMDEGILRVPSRFN
jgi:hypothetical protein